LDRGPEKTLALRPNGGAYLPDGKVDKRTFYTRIASPKGLSTEKVHLIATEEHPLEGLLSHRKATIIGIEDEKGDMQVHVFNGDLNDSDEHILWRGVHHEITGPAVEGSVDNMIELWEANAHQPLPASVVALMKAPQPEKPGMVDIETIGHRGRADQTIKNTFLASIEAMPANGHYIVAAPYNYDADEFRATVDAAKRVAAQQKRTGGEGHPPILLMPMHNDVPSIAEAFESAIPELLKAGVEVRYYNGAKYWNGFSHSKRGIIFYSDPNSLDSNGRPVVKGIAYNGTSNWDRRSTFNNWEETHLVSDKASLTALAQTFADDIKESVLVTLDAHGKVVVGGAEVSDKREILDKLAGHFEGVL
jgi:phosphatidylserine/phosphatidylglycerophosphate/cardiolipin synthase-like enzyme